MSPPLPVDARFESRLRRDEPMSRHTSWHVGGPADVFFTPKDRTDLLERLAARPRHLSEAVGMHRQKGRRRKSGRGR